MTSLSALLIITSCNRQAPAAEPAPAPARNAPPVLIERPAAPTAAHTARARSRPAVIATEDFTVPLPDGYRDITAEMQREQPTLDVVFEANRSSRGYTPTIVVRNIPIPGGSFADPAACAETGNELATAGEGSVWLVKRALVVDGPAGKACQIELLAPEGIALITELHRPGNTPSTPKRIWLMTCNHGDGDTHAEATCRSTLAGFRFRGK